MSEQARNEKSKSSSQELLAFGSSCGLRRAFMLVSTVHAFTPFLSLHTYCRANTDMQRIGGSDVPTLKDVYIGRRAYVCTKRLLHPRVLVCTAVISILLIEQSLSTKQEFNFTRSFHANLLVHPSTVEEGRRLPIGSFLFFFQPCFALMTCTCTCPLPWLAIQDDLVLFFPFALPPHFCHSRH